jgi:glycosyltransferase involved in cell wall biosynthesis
MKICRIIYSYSPYSLGGADIYAEKIHKELIKTTNCESVIITITPDKNESIEDRPEGKIYRLYPFNISTQHKIGKEPIIKQFFWSFLDLYSFSLYRKYLHILKTEKPDVVHLHTPVDVSLSVVNAVKKVGLPLVYTLHDYFLLCRKFTLLHSSGKLCSEKNINLLCKFYRIFTKSIIDNKIDILIAPSQFVLDIHLKYGFFKNLKAVLLPHGIELKDSDYTDSIDPEKGNKEFINILSTSALTQQKGVDVLIRAFLKIKNKKLKLIILNSGLCESQMRNLAKSDERITFYGRLNNQDMEKFYRIADVLVVPSVWYDVRPNVIVEAFKYGIPVVASNIGGIPELVKDNYNGYLFTPGDVEELKNILEKIAAESSCLTNLGKNARQSIERHEMSVYCQKLFNIYKEAISSYKGRLCAAS